MGGSIKLERDMDNSQNWTYQQGVGGVLVDYTGTPITDADISSPEVVEILGIRNGGEAAVISRLSEANAWNKRKITSTDKRNRLIIDHKAMQEIMMHDVIQYDNGVEFFVKPFLSASAVLIRTA